MAFHPNCNFSGNRELRGSQGDRGCYSWWERVWGNQQDLLLRTGMKTLSDLLVKEHRCIDYFLVAVTKPDKINLKEERLILLTVGRYTVHHGGERHGSRSVRRMLTLVSNQEAETNAGA